MDENFDFGGQIEQQPKPDYIENAHLTSLLHQHGFESLNELMRRSIEDMACSRTRCLL